jgi:hypothetical protein
MVVALSARASLLTSLVNRSIAKDLDGSLRVPSPLACVGTDN